jgi:hypothetical protein
LATDLLARMRSGAMLCCGEGLECFSSFCFGILLVKL